MIRAIFFDFGGVIQRTEYQSPRQHLAERLNMEYDDLVRLVFDSETSRKACLGAATVDAHWTAVMKKLNRPSSESHAFRDEFFGGDVLDRELIQLMRELRRQKFVDVFDAMTISAEVGVVKPEAKIFQIALDQLQVRAKEAILVDDFIENIEGCEKVGMQGLHFKDPEKAFRKLKALL